MNKMSKIIGYWAIAMLNDCQPKGEQALQKLKKLTDTDTANAILFISGFCGRRASKKRLKKFVKTMEKMYGEKLL